MRRIALKNLVCRLNKLDRSRQTLVVEASVLLVLSRAALLAMPFRHIAARLGVFASPNSVASVTSRVSISSEQTQLALNVGWAVTRVAHYAPFKLVCLPQAMAAKLMLKRRGVPSVLHFGAARNKVPGGKLAAHAWLDAAGVEITGYPVDRNFVEIACFV